VGSHRQDAGFLLFVPLTESLGPLRVQAERVPLAIRYDQLGALHNQLKEAAGGLSLGVCKWLISGAKHEIAQRLTHWDGSLVLHEEAESPL